MADYLLLLNHTPDRYENVSEDDMMALIGDYVAWVEDLSVKGIYKGGEKLVTKAGKVLSSETGSIEVHDGPYTELAEVLGGYMIISASSYDAAVDIAKTCPHLKHNTRLEIREIQDTGD